MENIMSVTGIYLNNINKIPLLTEEEEKKLALRVLEHDEEARERLISSNLRWVVKVAKTYLGKCSTLTLMDLIQEGNKGLITAVDKFDPNRGVRFTTYATYWIKQAIGKAIIEQGRTIRVPANVIALLNKYNNTVSRLFQELGRRPKTKEIADAMEVTEKVVKDLIYYTQDAGSLDNTINEDQDVTVGDMVADEHSEDFLDVHDGSLSAEINKVLGSLTDKERQVITLRFGLKDNKARTLKECGEVMHLSEERIRQIQEKALGKLRNPIRSKRLREYL